MNWEPWLEAGEQLRWEGRPAPRCYTFRHWPHSLFGLLLLPPALVWLQGGDALAEERANISWVVLPWLALGVALWFLIGHLLWSRLTWEGLFYAVSDRRLLLLSRWPRSRLRSLSLADIRWFRLKPRGTHLGSLVVLGASGGRPLALPCIEHPEPLVRLLRASIESHSDSTA